MNRRIFIERTGRTFLLGGLALMSGLLIARRQVGPVTECNVNFRCKSCRKLTSCTLPEAETQKAYGKERSEQG